MNLLGTIFLLILGVSALAEDASLKIAIVQEWENFNPVTYQLAANESLNPLISRNMASRDAQGLVIPDVAEKIPALKNKKATWNIKPAAKWADGTDLTCADWELGWKVGGDNNVSVSARNFYTKITKIEWKSDSPKKCEVTYATEDWSYDRDLPPFLPKHLEQKVFDLNKGTSEGYNKNTLFIKDPTNPGLYNGPYRISEFKLSSHIILVPNEHFMGTKPEIQKIIVKHIPDASSLKTQLATGEVNMIDGVGFPPDTAIIFDEDFSKQNKPFKVRFVDSFLFQGMFLNLEKPILKDIQVRKALSMAVNKQMISESFFRGKLPPAEAILPRFHPLYKKENPIFSKSEAAKLLDKAGWKLNAKNIREKEGKTLSLVFKVSSGIKVLENIETFVCDQYKDIGVQCIVKNEPPRVLLGDTVQKGDFDIAIFGQPVPTDTSLSSYFSSKEIPNEKNSWTGGNIIRASLPELDNLLTKFDSAFSIKDRNKIAVKIKELIQKEYLLIPLYYRTEAFVHPANLTGITESFGGTTFDKPELWKLKK